jgi:hypothetical protein
MLRAPVHLILHLQCYATSTGTSNSTSSMLCYEHRYIEFKASKQAPVHQRKSNQISNTSIYSEQIHISTNHNTLGQFIPTFNFVISSSDQKTFGSVLSSLLSSVDLNLYLNFSLNQRDNILLVTFLNQSSTHRLVYLLHIRVRRNCVILDRFPENAPFEFTDLFWCSELLAHDRNLIEVGLFDV